MQRDRQQQCTVGCANTGQFRQREIVIIDVLDDVEGAHKVEYGIGKRQRRYRVERDACRTLAQFRKGRLADVHEVRPLDRKPRAQARCDFEPAPRLRNENLH